MAERKDNSNNKPLSDVEKLLLLLSDLQIIDSKDSTPPISNLPSISVDANQNKLINPNIESLDKSLDVGIDIDRSPAIDPFYPFPSLLDELPFLRDFKPFKQDEPDQNLQIYQVIEDLSSSNDLEYLPLNKSEDQQDQTETISLIQTLLLGGEIEKPKAEPEQIPKAISETFLEIRSEDDKALHLLQDILVVPELEDLRTFKISVEQKLGLVESQVNSPELMNKIKDLESLVQSASLDLSNFGSKLTEIGDGQVNLPTEIAAVRKRIAQLEHHIYQPDELVQLLLPIIAELLSLKVTESRESMCQAIMPIIAEVIFERSQLDRVAMSHAFSEILPNAISERIRNNPEDIAFAIAPEMASAIREQIRLDRDAIVDALAPEMGAAIKRQIVLERDSMVDALYPVIGNTIAKYFAEAIRTINEKVEQTFSAEGLSRKIRAKMQGVSEAELILKESVPFQIQAIFLIHNLSGLVMIDIQQSDLDSLTDPIDADMLAGMLTAIRSFANECMTRESSNSELDAINYSGFKILLEVAGYCYLAVMIQGEPNLAFVNKIRNVFEKIIQIHGDRLKQFDGDPSIIPAKVEIELKTLMGINQTKSSKRSSKTLILISLAAFALILIPIGIYQYHSHRDRQLEAKVLEGLASTPELAVYRLDVSANGDRLKLSGKLPNQQLRDRAFQVAEAAAQSESKITNNIYAVNVPPDPELVAIEVQRLTKALNYTAGLQIATQFKDGRVIITGQIEQPSMIPKITQTYSKIAGVTTVTNAATLLTPVLSTRIYFPFGITDLQPIDLEKLIEVQNFLEMYPDYDINIFAKNDDFGNQMINNRLGEKRTQIVRSSLLKRGVKANRLHISGIIATSTQSPSNQTSRWVEFQPTLRKLIVQP